VAAAAAAAWRRLAGADAPLVYKLVPPPNGELEDTLCGEVYVGVRGQKRHPIIDVDTNTTGSPPGTKDSNARRSDRSCDIPILADPFFDLLRTFGGGDNFVLLSSSGMVTGVSPGT
jgi:hypothetical protein